MIKKLFKKFFSKDTGIVEKPCICGEREICSDEIKIHRSGAISRTSEGLLKCGKIRREMQKTSKVSKKHVDNKNKN